MPYSSQSDQTRLYGARASVTFEIDGETYVAVGHDRAYITEAECLAMYTDVGGPATECTYLQTAHNRTSAAVAAAAHCATACATNPSNPGKALIHRRTETVIYKLGQPIPFVNADGNVEYSAPPLEEHQRIPSLGVFDLHYFEFVEPATQDSYEACGAANTTGCYSSFAAPRHRYLAIANTESTCESNLVAGTTNPADPERVVRIYEWNESTLEFEASSALADDLCQVRRVRSFQVSCQEDAGVDLPEVPNCGVYLAAAEDCRRHPQFVEWQSEVPGGALTAARSVRVSFHRWDGADGGFDHCQPYPDPGDPRNQAESMCFQPSDPQRSPGTVAAGDEHFYDFPDLLPQQLRMGFELTDDGSGYYPQLNGESIAGLDFGVALAQKDIFYVDERGQDLAEPVADNDDEPLTHYYINGRRRYERVFGTAYDQRNVHPQVFGLEAVHAKNADCARNHPTTPRRRQFMQVQTLTDTSGGRDVAFFQQPALNGVQKAYFVFPQRHSRSTTVPIGTFSGSGLSSIYINEVCGEYTQFSFTRTDILNGGIFEPVVGSQLDGTGETQFCPYSLEDVHVEAWEAFQNYYDPVSPCKGFSANYEGSTTTISQPFYNSPPPASKLVYRGAATPTGPYVHPRDPASPVTVNTHFYSAADYAYLHEHRDDLLQLLQRVPTFQANTVALHRLCGSSGQLWMVFGNDGSDGSFDDKGRQVFAQAPPDQTNFFYVWNDRYAVDSTTGIDCTAAAARAVFNAAGIRNGRLGCFETKELVTPINTGATYALELFSSGAFLYQLSFNYGEGDDADIDPTLCSDLAAGSTDRTPLSATPAGVLSHLLVADIETSGGLICRQAVSSDRSLDVEVNQLTIDVLRNSFVALDGPRQIITAPHVFAGDIRFDSTVTVLGGAALNSANVTGTLTTSGDVNIGGDVNIDGSVTVGQNIHVAGNLTATNIDGQTDVDTLRSIFVTLDGDQTVTGKKTFTASETVMASLSVNGNLAVVGEATIDGDLTVDNIITFGLVDNVDVGLLQSRFADFRAKTVERLVELEASVCSLEAALDATAVRLDLAVSPSLSPTCPAASSTFSALTGQCEAPPAQVCAAAAKATQCYPLASLTPAGVETLRRRFIAFLNASNPEVAVSNVDVSSESNVFVFVVRDNNGQALTKAAILNATDFFDDTLCSRVFIPASQDGLVPVEKTVEWLDIPCEQFGSDRLDQFRRAVAANLSHYGVRAGDVVISASGSAGCTTTPIDFYVATAPFFLSDVELALDSEDYWQEVYDNLSALDSDFFTGLLRYLGPLTVGANAGSGSGFGDGSEPSMGSP